MPRGGQIDPAVPVPSPLETALASQSGFGCLGIVTLICGWLLVGFEIASETMWWYFFLSMFLGAATKSFSQDQYRWNWEEGSVRFESLVKWHLWTSWNVVDPGEIVAISSGPNQGESAVLLLHLEKQEIFPVPLKRLQAEPAFPAPPDLAKILKVPFHPAPKPSGGPKKSSPPPSAPKTHPGRIRLRRYQNWAQTVTYLCHGLALAVSVLVYSLKPYAPPLVIAFGGAGILFLGQVLLVTQAPGDPRREAAVVPAE